MRSPENRTGKLWQPTIIVTALIFMYATVLWKLGSDWWSDDNYSHGLLVPFVIGYLVWLRFEKLRAAADGTGAWAGVPLVTLAAVFLLAGTMASVLVVQRISLVVMIAGVIASFFGTRVLRRLSAAFLLLLLAIPIPDLIFNKIAFPMQILASRVAEASLHVFNIAVERRGNVIEIPHAATGEIISLEVVEACSGIRSLMTLITLALILGYFTRIRSAHSGRGIMGFLRDRDVLRTALLMAAAVPVALVTNATRVIVTGLLAHFYGRAGVEGAWHDAAGSLVFLAALGLLLALNLLLRKSLGGNDYIPDEVPVKRDQLRSGVAERTALLLCTAIIVCGVFVNWFQYRGELQPVRRPLAEIPARLGGWEQRNEDIRFDADTEKVLRASDYVMRDYYGPGKRLNLYVGYYSSQRTGATYHSPLSCLPGTGWEMADHELLPLTTAAGRQLTVNRYIVRQGDHQEYLIYWYQGRGRSIANEYEDKLYTSLDSVMRRRSDGGMVRIMTPLGKDPSRSLTAALDLTSQVADVIGDFLPD